MAGQKEIKAKIGTVKNIKKITRAMEMIARTKMKRAVDGVLSVRPYALYARELLMHVASDPLLESPYLTQGKGGKTLLVVIAADRGLCGGYNANVSRMMRQRMAEGGTFSVVAIGKKAVREVKKLDVEVLGEYENLPDRLTAEYVVPIAEIVRTAFLSGAYEQVEVIFTDYVSPLTQKTTRRTILPITQEGIEDLLAQSGDAEDQSETVAGEATPTAFSEYIFEPSTGVILNTVLPRLVDVGLLHALLESRASEESTRMFAMKNATENAEKLKDELTLSYNRARQQGITQEIAEIAAGADALS